jgi:hypothetical protein
LFERLFLLGAVGLAGGGGVAAASAATAPVMAGGVIHVAEVGISGGIGHDVITGAFADAGVDHSGIAGHGLINKIVLTRGSFEVNTASLGTAINNAYGRIIVTPNCSFFIKVTGAGTIFDGTGAYAGIRGKWTGIWSSVGVLPRKANGQCNESNSAPLVGQIYTVAVSGTVAFK